MRADDVSGRTIDPIAELLADLERSGRPSLAWTVRWSRENHDPVFLAWQASHSADAMSAFLGRYAPALLAKGIEHLERTLGPGWYHWRNSEIAPVLRAAVPVPPTIEQLVAPGGPSN